MLVQRRVVAYWSGREPVLVAKSTIISDTVPEPVVFAGPQPVRIAESREPILLNDGDCLVISYTLLEPATIMMCARCGLWQEHHPDHQHESQSYWVPVQQRRTGEQMTPSQDALREIQTKLPALDARELHDLRATCDARLKKLAETYLETIGIQALRFDIQRVDVLKVEGGFSDPQVVLTYRRQTRHAWLEREEMTVLLSSFQKLSAKP